MQKSSKIFLVNTVILLFTAVLFFVAPFAKPRVLQASIASGDTNIANTVDQQIKIQFSRPMNQQEVEKNLQIQPLIQGNISWANNTLFFTAKKVLQYHQKYTVTVSGEARDIYERTLGKTFTYTFQTKNHQFIYEDAHDQLVLSDFSRKVQPITTDKVVKEYQVNSLNHIVIYLNQPQENGNSEIYEYNWETGQTQRLLPNLKAHLSNLKMTGDGTEMYFLSEVPDPNSSADQNNTKLTVYRYNVQSRALQDTDLLKTFPTLVRFWITPDGNTFLVNDVAGELFLRAIQGGQSVALGKYADYGGGDAKGDKLLFLDTSPDFNYVEGIVMYDGDAHRLTSPAEISTSPFMSRDGTIMSYSYVPKGRHETLGQQGVRVANLVAEKNIFDQYNPDVSMEMGRLSADNQYLAVEVYTKAVLADFAHVRKYGEPNKPEDSQLKFFNVSDSAELLTIPGKELTWVE